MAWYDTFSSFYDRSLERTYRPFRSEAFEHLKLDRGQCVLDLACGTGQNFPFLAPRVGDTGLVIGLDASGGMLGRAQARAQEGGWEQVRTLQRDASECTADDLRALGVPERGLDAIVCTLGLTVLPDWRRVLDLSCAQLRPGGQYLVMDVLSERWNPMKMLVERLAQADITRDVAGELAKRTEGCTRQAFPEASPWTFGGTLFVAHGRRE